MHLEVSDLRRDKVWQKENPEKWEQYIQMSISARVPIAMLRAHETVNGEENHDTYDRLSQIKAPVLLLGGKFDGVAPVENMQAIADEIESSEIRFYEGGHMFLVQDKKAYPEMIEWLMD